MRKGLCCIFQRCCVSITRPTRGIERRDGPSGPYLVQYHAETPDCRNKLRTHVRMYYARARGIQYRKFGIFTNGTIGWDSVINTELVCAFSCEAPRWIRNVEKHSKVSLNRGLVEKPSFIDRSNSIVCNEGPFPSFFFSDAARMSSLNDATVIFFLETFNRFRNAFVGHVKGRTGIN